MAETQEPSNTAEPTDTAVPTEEPTETRQPTNTARPTNTPNPEPTSTTAATQPPAISANSGSSDKHPGPRPTGRDEYGRAPTNTLAPTEPPPSPTTEVVPGDVQINYVFFNGVEPTAEGDEYAVIQNIGSQAVNLQGWQLNAGADEQSFNFPGYTLEPGASCRVYTNRVFPEYCGFSFNSGRALWNNGGDCGYLFDNTGTQVSSYCY